MPEDQPSFGNAPFSRSLPPSSRACFWAAKTSCVGKPLATARHQWRAARSDLLQLKSDFRMKAQDNGYRRVRSGRRFDAKRIQR
jgi:hypothetical protein